MFDEGIILTVGCSSDGIWLLNALDNASYGEETKHLYKALHHNFGNLLLVVTLKKNLKSKKSCGWGCTILKMKGR